MLYLNPVVDSVNTRHGPAVPAGHALCDTFPGSLRSLCRAVRVDL